MATLKPNSIYEWVLGGVIALVVLVVLYAAVQLASPAPATVVRQGIQETAQTQLHLLSFKVSWRAQGERSVFRTELSYQKPDPSCITFGWLSLMEPTRHEVVTIWIEEPAQMVATENDEVNVLVKDYVTTEPVQPGRYLVTRTTQGYCSQLVQLPTLMVAEVVVGGADPTSQ